MCKSAYYTFIPFIIISNVENAMLKTMKLVQNTLIYSFLSNMVKVKIKFVVFIGNQSHDDIIDDT